MCLEALGLLVGLDPCCAHEATVALLHTTSLHALQRVAIPAAYHALVQAPELSGSPPGLPCGKAVRRSNCSGRVVLQLG